MTMSISQTLQTNGEFNITTSDDILNLEFLKFRFEAQFLDNSGVLSGGESRVIL